MSGAVTRRGCLWLLQTMGTPWEIELEGAILFFEDTHTPPYYLDGELVQLAHAGKLEQVAGVVVGQLDKSDYGDLRPVSDWARSRTIEDVLEERLEPLGVPAIYGLPLGHTRPLRTSTRRHLHARRGREGAHGRRAALRRRGISSTSWWTKRPRITPMT